MKRDVIIALDFKDGETALNFLDKFQTINGKRGKVITHHQLWGTEIYQCDRLEAIVDENRTGVVVKGHEIYIPNHTIHSTQINDNTFSISDGRFTITAIINIL